MINDYFAAFDNELTKTNEKVFYDPASNERKLTLQAMMIGTKEMPIAAGREYYVIFNTQSALLPTGSYVLNDANKSTLVDPTLYTRLGNCDVSTDFTLVGTISVEVDGQTSLFYGGAEMCANTRPTFAVNSLSYIIDGVETAVPTEELGLYFDWFKGDQFDFDDIQYYVTDLNDSIYTSTKANGVVYVDSFTVKTALNRFRKSYARLKIAKDGAAHEVNDANKDSENLYTSAMRKLLIDLSTDKPNTGFDDDNTLKLYSKSYTPLIENELGYQNKFLAIPIVQTLADIKVEGQDLSGILCLQEQPMVITSSDIAPEMSIGDAEVSYKIPIVPVRVGLNQILELSSDNIDDADRKNIPYLKIPIRLAKFSHDDFNSISDVINSSTRYRQIVLSDTDDELVLEANKINTTVGIIQMISVHRQKGGDTSVASADNYVAMYFYKDKDGKMPITFREGYSYTLKFFISEYQIDSNNYDNIIESNTCEGSEIGRAHD